MNKHRKHAQPSLPASGMVLLGMAASYLIGHLLADKSKKTKLTYHKNAQIDQSTTLRAQGWDMKNGYVDLRSFDEGRNWYVVEGEDREGLFISGKAEELYPGLLKEKTAFLKAQLLAAGWQKKELN